MLYDPFLHPFLIVFVLLYIPSCIKVDGKSFTLAKYDKRTPGLFKEEKRTDKLISSCSKMYCCSDLDEKEKPKYSCKGIQHQNNEITYKRFENVLFNKDQDIVLNKGFRYVGGCMKSYEQVKKGLSLCIP